MQRGSCIPFTLNFVQRVLLVLIVTHLKCCFIQIRVHPLLRARDTTAHAKSENIGMQTWQVTTECSWHPNGSRLKPCTKLRRCHGHGGSSSIEFFSVPWIPPSAIVGYNQLAKIFQGVNIYSDSRRRTVDFYI